MYILRKKKIIAAAAILTVVVLLLCLNVWVREKFIRTYTYTEIENRGYTSADVSEIKIDHSYFRRIIGYNE